MALGNDGTVYGWGDNYYGQLGNGKSGIGEKELTAVKVVGPNGVGYLDNIVAISAGYWHSLAIDTDGTIWVWGKNSDGQLGLGDLVDRNTPHSQHIVYNNTQQTFHFTIQDAIDNADNGDVIEASPGTYFENIDFLTKTITLRSADPNNRDVVADTIIDGSNLTSDVVTFNNNPNSVLAGFTIINGNYGINCNSSSPQVINCIIRDNTGHGVYCVNSSSLTIINSRIQGNGYNEYSPVSYRNGIYCDDSEITVSDCNIEDNYGNGIYCVNKSSLTITGSRIKNNGSDDVGSPLHGILCVEPAKLTITNSIIEGSNNDGIYCDYNYDTSLPVSIIANNIIRGNGDSGIRCFNNKSEIEINNNWIHSNSSGIYIYNATPPVTVRNNTIVNNTNYGIELGWSDDADISNCIIWGSNPLYTTGYNVTYSCIQDADPNDDSVYTGEGNIDDDPLFYNPTDPNDYHLSPDSNCIDAGNTGLITDSNETDIDGEDRVIDGDSNGTVIVDMGADEYYWSGADFNGDGFVNFIDYTQLASAWQIAPADNDYNDIYDLVDNNFIDYSDLALFCEDWLWAAGWTKTFPAGTDNSAGAEALYSSSSLSTSSLSTESLSSEPQPVDIEKLIKWLDDIWLNGEMKEVITEDRYLEFRKSVEESYE